jgi:RNA methyltransferase, TrmH family
MAIPVSQLRSDALVHHIRQLRSADARQRTSTCYIEGARIVLQAIAAGVPIHVGVIAPALSMHQHAQEAIQALRDHAVPITSLSADDFTRLSFKEQRHGVGAIIETRITSLNALPHVRANWVALSGIGNPGNLGAMLRTCDAVGTAGMLLLDQTVDPYHPAAIRASMGALFSQHMVRTSFAACCRWAIERGYPLIGTSPDAAQSYRELIYPAPFVLLLGSERQGLSDDQQAACQTLVRIPMCGTSDSLNVAVAASIILYEAFQQR